MIEVEMKGNMEEKERIRLKEYYENMPDGILIEKLSEGKNAFKEGVYKIILEEAKRREIDIKITRPSYEELLNLNPLLRIRSPKEVNSLLDTIEDCGYRWDSSQKAFYNSKIFRVVRTQGLDMFTPEDFKHTYNLIYQEYKDNPEQYNLRAHGQYLWSFAYPVLLVSFYLLILTGWLFLNIKWWLSILAVLYVLVGFLKYIYVTYPNSPQKRLGDLFSSILISPIMLLLFPIVQIFTTVHIMLMAMISMKRR